MLGVVLGQVMMMSAVGTVLSHALRRSALPIDSPGSSRPGQASRISGIEGNANMGYDIIGDDLFDDDDDVGGIGAVELIGDDDDDDYDIGADDDDDLTDELISGDGMSEIVGARRRRRRRRSTKRRSGRKVVVRRSPSRERRYPLGFTPTDIATTVTTTIAANPQSLYRPERLIVPSDIAGDIGIVDVKVGTQSQFVQNTEVPAAIFSEVAIDAYVHFDSAEVGNQIYVQSRNKSSGTVNFTAAIIGTVAK